MLLVAAGRACCSSPTVATASRQANSSAAAGVDAAIASVSRWRRRRDASRPRRRPAAPSRVGGRRASRGRSSGRSPASGSPIAELVADGGPRRSRAPGEGRGRGRAHRRRRGRSPTTALATVPPTCSTNVRPSTTSRSSSTPRSGGAAPRARRSTRSSAPDPTAPSRTLVRETGGVERRRSRRHRLRREGRRLLLRHDAHDLDRRSVADRSADARGRRCRAAGGGRQRCAAGVTVRDVDAAAPRRHRRRRVGRRVLARHRPRARSRDPRAPAGDVDRRLHCWPPGNVVTVEPGVYLPEHGGVRIEDTVLVTSDGCQPLTTRRSSRRSETPRHLRTRGPHAAITTNDLKNGITLQLAERVCSRRRLPAREAGQGRRVRAHDAARTLAPAP